MKFVVKCPSCHSCGEVPDQFMGLRIRCLSCQNRFVVSMSEMVMTPLKPENVILEYDSIELFACPRCSSLGVLINRHASRFYRCPDCKALFSMEGGPGPARKQAALPRYDTGKGGTAPVAPSRPAV
jgi:hypothetical protein